MDAAEYLQRKRDLLGELTPEEFIRANNYLSAAMRMIEADTISPTKASIACVNEVALRLVGLYPEGLPLTFQQLIAMDERGVETPPQSQLPDWWAGRV